MDMKQLTLKQKEFFEYIKSYKTDKGVFPTYEVIKDHFGYKSPNSVTQNIESLLNKGYLSKIDGKYFINESDLISKEQIIELMATAYLAGHQDTVDGNVAWCSQGSKEVAEEIYNDEIKT